MFSTGSYSPTEPWFTEFASDFSFFNIKNHTLWLLYRWSQEEMEIEVNFNCRREMYSPMKVTSEWHSLDSKSTKNRLATWPTGLLFLSTECDEVALCTGDLRGVYHTPTSTQQLLLEARCWPEYKERTHENVRPAGNLSSVCTSCGRQNSQGGTSISKVRFSPLLFPTSIIRPFNTHL